MKIAYLMNTYPITSTTFVRREIEALERQGVEIVRYASRAWSEPLVDPLDQAEAGRTHYLLSGNTTGLVSVFVRNLVSDPRAVWRGAAMGWQLARAAGEPFK